MMIIIGILSLAFFCLGVLLIMVSMRGFKLYRNGDLEYLGRGYKSQLVAENSFYARQDKRVKLSKGFIMDENDNLLSNTCPSDAEIYLRLKQ